jgi:hypothetical protein
MKQYLLSVYQPDGGPPASVDVEQIGRDLAALNDEMKAAGVWVFADGLNAPSTATVVRFQGGEVLTTGRGSHSSALRGRARARPACEVCVTTSP